MPLLNIHIRPWAYDHEAQNGEVPTAVLVDRVTFDGIELTSHQDRDDTVALRGLNGFLHVEITPRDDAHRAQLNEQFPIDGDVRLLEPDPTAPIRLNVNTVVMLQPPRRTPEEHLTEPPLVQPIEPEDLIEP